MNLIRLSTPTFARRLFLALVLWAIPQSVVGDEQALKKEFVAAYHEPAARLERFYRNIDLTEVPEGTWATKRYGSKAVLRWRASGTRFRDDVINANGRVIKSHLSLGDVKCAITAVGRNNPRMTVAAAGDAGYAFTQITDVEHPEHLAVDHTESPRLAFAAYCIYDEPILAFVKRENVTVTAFENQSPGQAKLKLSVRREDGSVYPQELVFNKELGWALERDQFRTKATSVEYGETIDGIPLVKKLTYWQEGKFEEPFFTATIKEITPGPPPDSVFSPAEFGLPDLPRPKKDTFPWLAVLGVAGVALALVLGWMGYRRRTARA